jgi:hypothetical protein
MSASSDPVPFIVGVPLWDDAAASDARYAHPEFAIPPETGFFAAKCGEPAEGRVCPKDAWEAIRQSAGWPDYGLSEEDVWAALEGLPEGPALWGDALRAFYRLYAARQGKRRWGDKTPNHGLCMHHIERHLPEAHFIHIIRDGRAVAHSVRHLWFSPGETLREIAADWRDQLTRLRALGSARRHYLEVRYEDLICNPSSVLRRLCGYLRLPFDDAMLAHHERATARLAEHQARHRPDGSLLISKEQRLANQAWNLRPPSPERMHTWTLAFSPDERRACEDEAGVLLEQLGYAVWPCSEPGTYAT